MSRKEFMQWLGVFVLGLCAVVIMLLSVHATRRDKVLPKESEMQDARQDMPEGRIENAYIVSCVDNALTVWYKGVCYVFSGTLASPYTGVADLEIEDGKVIQVDAKPETIEGILDSYSDGSVQISGYAVLNYTGSLPVYRIQEERVSQKTVTDLVIGTSHVQLVVADGRACAILQYSQDIYANIRVLIKNKSSLTFGTLYLTCDKNFQADDKKLKKHKVVSAAKYLKDSEAGTEIRVTSELGLLYLCDSGGEIQGEGYEGDFLVRKCEDGYALINEVPIETYLRYVLPSEMPTYFSYEALKAQAVCARTFAYKQMLANTYASYGANLDDSTAFQVYHASCTYEVTDQAVEDTQGLVLTTRTGELIDCYYYSTGSGYSENLRVWNADSPEYLAAENQTREKTQDLSDDALFHTFISGAPAAYDDASPYYRWEAELSAKLGMDETYGRLKKLKINERSSSGYILSLTVIFEDGERTYDRENDIRFALSKYLRKVTLADGEERTDFGSLPSACFEVTSQKDGTILLRGGGFGHGIGMSQYGADGMGQEGKNWQEILDFYYKGTTVTAN